MPLAAGTHLGPYEILSELGAGGMAKPQGWRQLRTVCAWLSGVFPFVHITLERLNELDVA